MPQGQKLNVTYLIWGLMRFNIPHRRGAAAAEVFCLRACHGRTGQMRPEPPHQMAGDCSVGRGPQGTDNDDNDVYL